MESNLSSAPQLDIIQSKQDRRAAGISHFEYVDAANQARMAQYNNEYNYWLWLQQAKYNSPAEQRKRLEEAGLNPNFQSVESGNLSSIPTSSGSITPSVGRNRAAMVANDIQAFNAVIKSIGEGIGAVSTISGIPADIKDYRKLLNTVLWNKADIGGLDVTLKTIEKIFGAKTKLGIDLGETLGVIGHDGSIIPTLPNWKDSPMVQNLNLKNEDLDWLVKLRQYDFEKMKPEELKLLKERADLIAEQAGLTGEQLRFFSAIATTKIGAAIAPIALAIFKML